MQKPETKQYFNGPNPKDILFYSPQISWQHAGGNGLVALVLLNELASLRVHSCMAVHGLDRRPVEEGHASCAKVSRRGVLLDGGGKGGV